MKSLRVPTLIIAAMAAVIGYSLYGQAESQSIETPQPSMTVMIPMRDGACLPADVFLAEGKASEQPCILVRAANGRKGSAPEFAPMTQWGYHVVIQDTRMVVDEEGKVLPYMSDGWGLLQDGYDTVEWLAEQEFCNGKVATMGASALGVTQLLLAPSAPPHLCCQYISNAAPSLYHYAAYHGGQLRRTQVQGWLGQYTRSDKALLMVQSQPDYNIFWQQLDARPHASKVNVPAVHIGGWYDTFLQGTIDAFIGRQEEGADGAKGSQKLILGPWHHYTYAGGQERTDLGDFELPDNARQVHLPITKKDWLDHHLKGESNSVAKLAPVTYYVMGPLDGSSSKGNVWRQAETWPVPAKQIELHLTADGGLSADAPASTASLEYRYDPEDPTPTVGGHNLFLEMGPKDQLSVEERDDVLVFTTEPLKDDLEVTGRVVAMVHFESDQVDTDVAVRLCDVYPDGRSVLITDGITRLASVKDPKAPGPHEVEVDLFSTSMVFAKGHRLRISVSSANYPRYERNLNVGRALEMVEGVVPKVATNKLHLGPSGGSRILLPVVESADDSRKVEA